jgi:hypothetical protein
MAASEGMELEMEAWPELMMKTLLSFAAGREVVFTAVFVPAYSFGSSAWAAA